MSADAGLRGAPGAGAPATRAGGRPVAGARRSPDRHGRAGALGALRLRASTATGWSPPSPAGFALFVGGFTLVGVVGVVAARDARLQHLVGGAARSAAGSPHVGLLALVGVGAASPTPSRRACARGGAGRPSPCASSSPPSPPGTAWTSTSPGGRRDSPGRAVPALVRASAPCWSSSRGPRCGRRRRGAGGSSRPPSSSPSPPPASSLFPVAQVFFFGRTDYRRPADVVVVFGAQVHEDGQAVDLAARPHDHGDRALQGRPGQARHRVRRRRGQRLQRGARHARHGRGGRRARRATWSSTPTGVNTDATVRDTVPFFGEEGWTPHPRRQPVLPPAARQAGLPAGGRNVFTVPAGTSSPIPQTPRFVVREIPAFWVYYLRGRLPLTGGRPRRGPAPVTCSGPRWPSAAATLRPACTRSGSGAAAPTEKARVVDDGLAGRQGRPEELVVAELRHRERVVLGDQDERVRPSRTAGARRPCPRRPRG